MGDDIKWLIGVGLGIGGFIISLIGLDRRTMRAISAGDKENAKDSSEKIKNLHAKLDDVKDTYVRRDDLAGHISHLEKSVAGMVDEQRRTNDRIDKILAAVIGDK